MEKDTIAFIYKPIACHSYNIIHVGEEKKEVCVATIDTMLNFYLAFLYADVNYYYKDRILCMAKFLFEVEEKNRLEQKGLLKRFSIDCYGKQPTLESMRMEKSEMFEKLKNKKGTEEYERWFLKYSPKNDGTRRNLSTRRLGLSRHGLSRLGLGTRVNRKQNRKQNRRTKKRKRNLLQNLFR